MKPLTTPDGRYLVVRGRLWRAANPGLAPDVRSRLVGELMHGRREVKAAGQAQDQDQERLAVARSTVHSAKIALGERGPVWWTDGTRDFNRHLVKNTPYASWYQEVEVPKIQQSIQANAASMTPLELDRAPRGDVQASTLARPPGPNPGPCRNLLPPFVVAPCRSGR